MASCGEQGEETAKNKIKYSKASTSAITKGSTVGSVCGVGFTKRKAAETVTLESDELYVCYKMAVLCWREWLALHSRQLNVFV